ncbi:hypothetical protein CH366_04460 [Leptospira harrisiae]|uniref:Uncharacterized protein n=1 Tax=Leptospira harrisiae TaxID=2023189 RepID=A0A2N0AMC0_9LEPT|nr:hypothetical protein CH364_04320 [Leptospira harrisiae]PKA08997.1 hypothetical protein CH366_04460 [Leptospira harrisiae]
MFLLNSDQEIAGALNVKQKNRKHRLIKVILTFFSKLPFQISKHQSKVKFAPPDPCFNVGGQNRDSLGLSIKI